MSIPNDFVTPRRLARELRISDTTLREWLRERFPRGVTEKWSQWRLTSNQISAARRRWGQQQDVRRRGGVNFWIVKCSESANKDAGWSWDRYFGEQDDYPQDGDWGGPDWIRSPASRKYIQRVQKGDLIVCYQAEGRQIYGISYMAGSGRDEPAGSGAYCMLRIVAGRKAVAFDPPLTVMQLREAGCNPKYLGPGSQGTIFPLTEAEFDGILLAASEWQPESVPTVNAWLKRVGCVRSLLPLATAGNPPTRGGGFVMDAEERAKIEKAAVNLVRTRLVAAGWRVTSVETQCLGYDLQCEKGRQRRDVEVKGVSGSVPAIIVTSREARQAGTNRNFRIYIVTDVLSKSPTIEALDGREFLKKYDLQPLQYRAVPIGSLGH